MATIEINDNLISELQHLAQGRGTTVETLLAELLASEKHENNKPPMSIDLPLFDSLYDGVLAIDDTFHIVYWNTSAEKIFGYRADEIIGQPLDVLIPQVSRKLHAQLVESFSETPTGRLMTNRGVYGQHKTGNYFFIEVTISTLQQHNQMLNIAIFRDVTRRETDLQHDIERSQLLQIITESVTELICVFDRHGLLTYVSPAIERVCGMTQQEALGTEGYNHVHPDDLTQVKQFFKEHRNDPKPHSLKFRSITKDGEILWVESTLTHVFDETGQILHSIGITRDVTEHHEAQEALKAERDFLSTIMAASPSGINAVDAQGNIIFANKRSEEILGVPTQKITDLSYDSPIWKHTDYEGNPWPDEKQPFMQVMKTKQPVWDVRHAIEWSTGEIVYLAINGMPILDENGEVDKIVFTVEDYTARKIQQDKLEEALKRAEYLSDIRAQFISMVNHEFRTPLQIINSSVDLLRMKLNRMSEQEFISRTDRIQQQIHILDEMLRDVAFINKYDRAGYDIKLEQLSLSEFFTNLAEELSTMFPNHVPIAITQKGADKINTDLLLMHHIFNNLLGNALKYSEPNKHVKCIIENRGRELYVEIQDSGRGIPIGDQDNIFDAFHRASNVGELQGSGLGLAITWRSIQRLHGKIHFASEEHVGTTFYVKIPLSKDISDKDDTEKLSDILITD